MNPGFGPLSPWLPRGSAFVLSFAAHTALLSWLLTVTVKVTIPPPAPIALELVRKPPQLPPLGAKNMLTARPRAHMFAARHDDWAVAATTEGGGNGPRRVPSNYADTVKDRIIAKLEYPKNAYITVRSATTGKFVTIPLQCTIPYQITVGNDGRMISYRIEPCGQPLLDAAAEAALMKAGPFPPPPDLGAKEYVIYGSANFLIQTGTAASGVRR